MSEERELRCVISDLKDQLAVAVEALEDVRVNHGCCTHCNELAAIADDALVKIGARTPAEALAKIKGE